MQAGHQKHLAVALYLNAALLAAVVVLLLTRTGGTGFPTVVVGSTAMGQATPPQQGPIAGGAGVFVMPAQFAEKIWGCYLLDVDQQTLCAYQYYPGEKQLRLIAARNYRYDRKLQNLNTDHPTPLEVKDLLDKEAQNPRGAPAGAP
jgi:hypothetical protein